MNIYKVRLRLTYPYCNQSLRRSVCVLTALCTGSSERICTELIHSIERSCSEVIQMIRDQEETEVSQAEGLLERLEQEIDDLKRDAELKQLSHMITSISYR